MKDNLVKRVVTLSTLPLFALSTKNVHESINHVFLHSNFWNPVNIFYIFQGLMKN